MALFEIREYQIFPGKMDEWVAFMETRIAPFMIARGFVIPAMFRGESDENLFIWIRRFDDDNHFRQLCKDVYESEDWLTNYKPTVRKLVDVEKAVIHRMTGTVRSPVR